MKNKKTLIIAMALVLVLSIVAVAYAYFASTINNDDPQRVVVEAGNLELTFNNGNGNLTGTIGVGQTLEKTFSITNNGTYDEYARISWLDLTNTYTEGSLVYSLEESEDGVAYTEVASGNVPVTLANEQKTVELADGLLVKADANSTSATYKNKVTYYKLKITLVDLGESVDQTADLNASMNTRFTLSKGTDSSTPVATSPIKCLDNNGDEMACPSKDAIPVGQRIAIGDQVFRYIRTTNTSDTNTKLNECADGAASIACTDADSRHPLADRQLRLLAEQNLMVGNYCTSDSTCTAMTQADLSAGTYGTDVQNETIGLQSPYAIGYPSDSSYPRYGTLAYGASNSSYNASNVKTAIEAYANTLNTTYFDNENVVSGSAITKAELVNLGCPSGVGTFDNTYPWVYSTSYWSGSASNNSNVWHVNSDGSLSGPGFSVADYFGARPVISISASLI